MPSIHAHGILHSSFLVELTLATFLVELTLAPFLVELTLAPFLVELTLATWLSGWPLHHIRRNA
jgi:hypothetical protein